MSDTNELRLVIADQLDRPPGNIIGAPSLSVGLVINREINHAIQHYESTRFRWNEVLEGTIATTASGTESYTLANDLVRLDTLKLQITVSANTVRMPLMALTWEMAERESREISGQGLPTKYAIYGNLLRLSPVPNSVQTLVGSYIRRFRLTSLTGSICTLTVMGGRTLTATSTASHNNRLNGWTTDGAELIRERAVAAINIKYFRDETARLEAAALAQGGFSFLSVLEKHAYERVALERPAIYSVTPNVPPRPPEYPVPTPQNE